MKNNAVLMGYCDDQVGIVNAVSNFIADINGNVGYGKSGCVYERRPQDKETIGADRKFAFKYEFSLDKLSVPKEDISKKFENVANKFKMKWRLHFTDKKYNLAIMVTKEEHCLKEILSRTDQGKLNVNIPLVISNHPSGKYIDLERLARHYNFQYDIFPKPIGNSPEKTEIRLKQEEKEVKLLKKNNIDLIVLAKYRQPILKNLLDNFEIINIHDSRLPDHKGRKAHHRAYNDGDKSTGSTTHFIIEKVDEGPVIETKSDDDITGFESFEEFREKAHNTERILIIKTIDDYIHHRLLKIPEYNFVLKFNN